MTYTHFKKTLFGYARYPTEHLFSAIILFTLLAVLSSESELSLLLELESSFLGGVTAGFLGVGFCCTGFFLASSSSLELSTVK